MRILIIEDERELATILSRAFRENAFAVDLAYDGQSGLSKAWVVDYDAIILDLMLPHCSGEDLLVELRKKKKTPVLVLTARDAVAKKVELLDRGADDYVTKPFALNELIARVKALMRRSENQPSPLIRVKDIEIDTAARMVTKAGQDVSITGKEYAILYLLAARKGRLVTRMMIYDHVYGDQSDTCSNVIDVYLANLRKKLGSDLIETRRGEGYIIRD